MKNHIELGKAGEEFAVTYLEKIGYQILDRNWRWGREELDIVARDGNFIVIVEVKTRRSDRFADPGSCVNPKKQRIQARAAQAYIRYKRMLGEIRFDVIVIVMKYSEISVNHVRDAFYATL
jgi:putative endonuclease